MKAIPYLFTEEELGAALRIVNELLLAGNIDDVLDDSHSFICIAKLVDRLEDSPVLVEQLLEKLEEWAS